jgi:hypothetical protein
MTIPNMRPHIENLLKETLILAGVMAILAFSCPPLRARGRIAATRPIMMPAVILLFGRAP